MNMATQQKLYSMESLHTPRAGKFMAWCILGIGVLFFIVLFLPWQQNIHGKGKVTALSPSNRPQTIETIIAGRIQRWRQRWIGGGADGATCARPCHPAQKRRGDEAAREREGEAGDSRRKRAQAFRGP